MSISDILANPLMTTVVIKAIVVGFLVSLCSSLLGVSLVLKRFSMIGDGLSHFGFFAVAIATVTGIFDFTIGNRPFSLALEFEMLVVVIVAIVLLYERSIGTITTSSESGVCLLSVDHSTGTTHIANLSTRTVVAEHRGFALVGRDDKS